MDKQSFAIVVRRFLSPTVLAGITVVGTLCVSSAAFALGHGGQASIGVNGLCGPTSLPTNPHSVMDSPSAGIVGHGGRAVVGSVHAGGRMGGAGVHTGRSVLPGRSHYQADPKQRIR